MFRKEKTEKNKNKFEQNENFSFLEEDHHHCNFKWTMITPLDSQFVTVNKCLS